MDAKSLCLKLAEVDSEESAIKILNSWEGYFLLCLITGTSMIGEL